MTTTYALKSIPAAAAARLVATKTDRGWQIRFHSTGKPFCSHVHNLDDLAAHYKRADARAVCPKCAVEGCAHRFVASVPNLKSGACFVCKALHAAPEKRAKLAKKCATMFVGQGWGDWFFPSPEEYEFDTDPEEKGERPTFTFADYPLDILTEIISHLDAKSVGNFIQSEITIWRKYKMNIPLRMLRLFDAFVNTTFPLMDEKYAYKYSPILIRDNLIKYGELKRLVLSKSKIIEKDEFVGLISEHPKELDIAYRALNQYPTLSSGSSLEGETFYLPKVLYNCRDPKRLFEFMRGFRVFLRHTTRILNGMTAKEYVVNKFAAVAMRYSFNPVILYTTLNDISLWPIDPMTKKPLVTPRKEVEYIYHITDNRLPSGNPAYWKSPKIEVYGTKHAVVISEALNFFTADLVVDGHLLTDSLKGEGLTILEYISRRWNDNIRYYAELLMKSLRMFFEWKVYMLALKYDIDLFIQKLNDINEDWSNDYATEIIKNIKDIF